MLKLPLNQPATSIGLVILLTGAVAGTAALWGRRILSEDVAFTATLVGIAVWVPTFGILCWWCRCERCGYKLFWHAVARVEHTGGIDWFVNADTCPKCASRGRSSRTDDG